MSAMEEKGEMKQWMRATVIWGDLLVWISAVVVYCRANFSKGRGDKAIQTVVSHFFSPSAEQRPDSSSRLSLH